jgi:adenylate kinase family enzyme
MHWSFPHHSTRRPRDHPSVVMRRISVVGNSGAGKSRFAAALAGRLSVPYVELDSIFHQPDWVPLPVDEFRRRVEAKTRPEGWVVDGNYSVVRDIVWRKADTVVWLDLPRPMVMWGVVTRTLMRAARRTELWNGNRERWQDMFSRDPGQSIILWSWTNHAKYHDRYRAAMSDPAWAHLRFVHLRSRREAERLLSTSIRLES